MEQIKRQYTSNDLHFRDADGDGLGVVSGKAICFGVPSNFMLLDNPCNLEREVICKEAITREFLDTQRILLTAWHNDEVILGASKMGAGTLKYDVRDDGVYFECPLPDTQHGREIRELIKRGDIQECSFIFTTPYFDTNYVEPRREKDEQGRDVTTFYVKRVTGVYDFTVCSFGAYSQTSCSARENQALVEYIKRTAQTLDELSIKETEDMTEQDINALAEKVADLVEERLKAREEEKEKEPEQAAEPEQPSEPEQAPVDEAPKGDDSENAHADAPADGNLEGTEPNDEDESERSMKESLDLIKRALNIA